MKRKAFRAGNSLVIALPAEWVRARGLREGSRLEVSVVGDGALEVRPSHRAEISAEFARQVDAFIDEYRLVLDELARS